MGVPLQGSIKLRVEGSFEGVYKVPLKVSKGFVYRDLYGFFIRGL